METPSAVIDHGPSSPGPPPPVSRLAIAKSPEFRPYILTVNPSLPPNKAVAIPGNHFPVFMADTTIQ
jgi:hypothetical protein